MDNTLMTIIGIFIVAILIFVFPLMSITERNDDISQSAIQTATAEFVDKISLSGLIKPSDYEEYIQKLSSTGNTFDVEIEVQHLDENFGKKNATTSKDLIGENERYSTFTTEILDNMYLSDGTSKNYVLKKGDNVIITAKNTNKTMAQTLRTFIYKVTGQGTYEISAISSSMVVNNGTETSNIQIGSSNENTSQEQQETITAVDITSAEYGKYVTNYRPQNVSNVGWRIFHSDGEHIYLIADDYIDIDKVPGKNGYNVTKDMELQDGGAQGGSWGQYEKGFGLRDDLLNQYNGSIATKATEYFIDREIWSIFKDVKYAEYAIGVPTLELFVASYNKTHPYKTIEIETNNGCRLKWSQDTDWNSSNELTGIDAYENLYIVVDTYNAWGMWIASPSYIAEGNKQYVMYVTGQGENKIDDATVIYNEENEYPGATNLGSRPIIALKSDVVLEKQDEDRYIIIIE